MPPDNCWDEKCATWNGSVAGFAIWIFLVATMFLVDAITYDTAQTNDMAALPDTDFIHDECRDQDRRLAIEWQRVHCGKTKKSGRALARSHNSEIRLLPETTLSVGIIRDASSANNAD